MVYILGLVLRLVVCITGASGVIYGVKFLEILRKMKGFEIYLIISRGAKKVIEAETDFELDKIISLADKFFEEDELEAPLSSSSYPIDGVVIVPASMKTLSAIAHGYTNSLIIRVADIALRLRKPLIVVPRETPLNAIHLENMLKLAKMGAVVLPACPGFYHRPQTIEDLLNFIVGKIMDVLGIKHDIYRRWEGVKK